MTLSYKEVAEILTIIDSSECEELVLEMENLRLVVRRGGVHAREGGADRQAKAIPAVQEAQSSEAPATPPAPRPDAQPARDALQGDVTEIRAPMVGTFYRRPSPNEPPYVEEGATVKAGETLGLIEVMKLYTAIEATSAGTVNSILAEDSTLVEFNQLLFTIQPH